MSTVPRDKVIKHDILYYDTNVVIIQVEIQIFACEYINLKEKIVFIH